MAEPGVVKKRARLTLLYDFYGPLLTQRQRHFMELYYHQDWSLGEIAEEFRISRQAVHDLLRRSEASLVEYERRLGLAEAFRRQRAAAAELDRILISVERELQRWETGEAAFPRELRRHIRVGRRVLQRLTP